MKKTLSLMLSLLIALSLAVTAFAASSTGNSIYASESEKNSFMKNIEDSMLGKCLAEYEISIDMKTVMPLYYANLYDYAESGKFEYEPYFFDGYKLYAADALNAENKFAGTLIFSEDDIMMYAPSDDKNNSVDFETVNAKRISALINSKASSLTENAKFMFVEGAGYVYYIMDGDKTSLIASSFKGANGDLFTESNKGIVNVDSALLSFAKGLAAEQKEQEEALKNLAPGENPPTGAQVPVFVADNSEYNFSHKNISQILFVAAIIFAVAYVVSAKACKRK